MPVRLDVFCPDEARHATSDRLLPLRADATRCTLGGDTFLGGGAMMKSFLVVTRSKRTIRARVGSSALLVSCPAVRAGQIGPIRREIIFEPVHEQPAPVDPAPVEPPPVDPQTQPQEPAPVPS
jgi:hypothetical protein